MSGVLAGIAAQKQHQQQRMFHGLRSTNELDPGMPHDSPCLSFWLGQARHSEILGLRTTTELPKEQDVVIIGSGLSGVVTAYFLLTGEKPPSSVTLLESREICHGATGRNGGHCRPNGFTAYSAYKKSVGKEQALKIMANEMDTLKLMEEIVQKEKLMKEVDWWTGSTYDVPLDEKVGQKLKEILAEYAADGGPVEHINWLKADAAKEASRVPSAVGAAEYPAASLWPYKLVCALSKICVSKGLNVQTNTPATGILNPDNERGGIIETPRGKIKASNIVHATNAFAAKLLPEFRGAIMPFRAHCTQITPTKAYSGKKMLSHSYVFEVNEEPEAFDYLIQRPADGSIIIGGGGWKADFAKQVNQTDDSEILPEITHHFSKCMSEYFSRDWGKEAPGEGLTRIWTGIQGYTHEDFPYVGEIEGRTGHYIVAGHCGHGMARIATASRGIAQLIQGKDYSSTGLPECFQPTKERMNRYSFSVQQQWMDRTKQVPGDKELWLKSNLVETSSFHFMFKRFLGIGAAASHMMNYTGPTTQVAQKASSSLSSSSLSSSSSSLPSSLPSSSTFICANGCFWGTQHLFDQVFKGKGLIKSEVGYAGGKTSSPTYRQVCSGATGHAEACKVEFNPAKVTYAELVEFFYRTHDPTQVDGQGPDRGTQYRSVIFADSDEQMKIAKAVTDEVQKTHYPNKKIATQLVMAKDHEWYTGEEYHQRYLELNPGGYECPTHRLHW